MNQEDRLKWTELISKDRDAFFSLNKSDYDDAIVVVISIILYILIF